MVVYKFVIEVDGQVVRSCSLSDQEMKLLNGGLFYARVRDSSPVRREAYKKLQGRLSVVWRGKQQ